MYRVTRLRLALVVGVATTAITASIPLVAYGATPAVPHPLASGTGSPNPTGSPTPTPSITPSSGTCPTAGSARPSVPAGTGPARSATFTNFPLTDKLLLQVNVGSGNALLTSTDLILPGATSDVTVGAVYNSLLVGSGVQAGAFGPGWRTATGVDVRLYPASDGSVTYLAPGGVSGVFTPSGSTSYTSPSEFKATLVKTSGGWELTAHDSGQKTYFTTDGRPDKVADRNGNLTDFSYGAPGQSTKVVGSRGTTGARTATVSTDASCHITSYAVTGDFTRTISYAYTGGAVTKITAASGRNSVFSYDGSGNITAVTMTDATNSATEKVIIGYDSTHRVTSVRRVTDLTAGTGPTTRFAYPSGTQTLVANPTTDQAQAVSAVPHITYTVNSAKRVTNTVDQGSRSRSDTYTSFSDVASQTTASGTTTYGYSTSVNSGESLTGVTQPSGAATSIAYGNSATGTNPTAAYQPSSATDAQSNKSLFTYNGAGNLASTADASAATANVTYNSDGTVATATDPGNGTNSSKYTYDANKDLTKVTPVTGSSLTAKTFTYDGFAQVKTVTDGRGVVTTYGYGPDGRVTSVSYSAGLSTVTYTNDPFGNVTKRVDGVGTTTYGYDKLNRLISRSSTTGGGGLTYAYDADGNLTTVTDGRGSSTMAYDSSDLQTTLTTAKGTVLHYAYDSDARRVDTWFATNAANTTWAAHTHTSYDKSGRVSRTWTAYSSSNSQLYYDTSWCYSPYTGAACPTASASTDKDLVQWSVDNLSGVRTTYTYDKGNRLTKQAPTSGKTYTYTYDSRGNRLTASDGTTTQTLAYNAANQVSTGGYGYDAAGNQTTDPTGGTLAYNSAGQLTAKTGSPYTYTYLGTTQDELVTQVLTGGTTLQYVYGRTDQFGRPVIQSLTKSDTGTTYLDYDGRGTPQVLTTTSGNEVYYILDDLGTPVGMVRSDGTKSSAYAYDPYGVYSTTLATGDAAGINPYRFAAGGVYDRGTTFIKYGQRWYNPTTGRFTQQDSINKLGDPAAGNRYAYAGDSPTNNVDPTGKSFLGCLGSSLVAAGAVLAFGGAVLTAPETLGGSLVIAGAGLGSLGADVLTLDACF